MTEPHYSLAVIRAAFWKTFHESGERWFNYFGTPEQNSSYTEGEWDGFAENLATAQRERLAPAIAAIRTLEDVAGHLHIVLDDENYEDKHLRFCEGYNIQNLHEMTEEQCLLERTCLAALWPLTPYERQLANEQAEAEELEAFYQRYPEKRPS
mgnify:CR=1 FL=1